MVKRICPNCHLEGDPKIVDYIWTRCFGNPFECPNCGAWFWRNFSLVIHEDTKGIIFRKDGKFLSKNEKGQIVEIKIGTKNI